MKSKWVLGSLLLIVIASALGVVYSKHESRKLFVQLQSLEKERDRMDIEWGKMQLEQSTWATHARIERLARKKLDMTIPDAKNVVILRP
jgi:cell division protein FtsL